MCWYYADVGELGAMSCRWSLYLLDILWRLSGNWRRPYKKGISTHNQNEDSYNDRIRNVIHKPKTVFFSTKAKTNTQLIRKNGLEQAPSK